MVLLIKIKADGGLCLATIDVSTRELLAAWFHDGEYPQRWTFWTLKKRTNKPVILVDRYGTLKPLASNGSTNIRWAILNACSEKWRQDCSSTSSRWA